MPARSCVAASLCTVPAYAAARSRAGMMFGAETGRARDRAGAARGQSRPRRYSRLSTRAVPSAELPGAIVNIGGVVSGCTCEEGASCSDQVWIVAYRSRSERGFACVQDRQPMASETRSAMVAGLRGSSSTPRRFVPIDSTKLRQQAAGNWSGKNLECDDLVRSARFSVSRRFARASRGRATRDAGAKAAARSARPAVRKKFGRDACNPLKRIGRGALRSRFPVAGSVWARSGGAVRSAAEKSLPGLRLGVAEPGSPPY